MGSLEAMAKGSEARYLSDTQNLKIAQVRRCMGCLERVLDSPGQQHMCWVTHGPRETAAASRRPCLWTMVFILVAGCVCNLDSRVGRSLM